MLVEVSIRVRVLAMKKRTDYKKQKVYEALFMDDIHGGWHLDANWL